MELLDTTILNVALPSLGRDFHAGRSSLEWVITGYLMSLAIFIPASGWIGDRFGTKKTFLFAQVMFVASSALCGLSWNVGSLIAFRILQGVGGGMLVPVGQAMLVRAFPPGERAQASVFLTIPTTVAPTIAPLIGGWLVDDINWRWIFYVNLPIGVIACLFSFLVLKEQKQDNAGRFDPWGFVLSGGGLALMLFALSRAPNAGWGSTLVVSTALAGALMFALLVFVELRSRAPMLDLRLYGNRLFRDSSLVLFCVTAGLTGLVFLMPLYLQDLRHFSAFKSGLVLVPQSFSVAVIGQLTGRIYPIVGPRRLLVFALVFFTIGSLLLTRLTLETAIIFIILIMMMRGLTMGFAFVSMSTAAFASISREQTGRASSLFATVRQVGASFGVAILATVLIDRTQAHTSVADASQAAQDHATLLGFHDAFLAAAFIALIGMFFAFRIRDEDAAPTMRARVQRVPVNTEEPAAVAGS
jgi:EmrB/QacA subfamily drug resistance transporter